MKWLIIGTGWISESFIEALRDCHEKVYGVYSRTKEKGTAFAAKNKITHVVTSLENIEDYDAVYIGSPNAIHYEQAKKVINHGKHVMIEKIMTHNPQLTKKLFELGKAKGVKVMEAYAHITNPEMRLPSGHHLKTNCMQLSSKIKNNTYKIASTFNKDLFGGVIPDLGVYPLSLSIVLLGNVTDYQISNKKFLNEVIVACKIKLTHENGISEFVISKVEDGDNSVYIDKKKVLEHVSGAHINNRMDAEVKEFIDGTNLVYYQKNSEETARVVALLLM